MPILISRIVTLVIALFFMSACEAKEDKELDQAQKTVKNYYTDYTSFVAVYVKKLRLEESDEERNGIYETMNDEEIDLAVQYFTMDFVQDALTCGPADEEPVKDKPETCFMDMFFDSPSPPYQIGKAVWVDPTHIKATSPILKFLHKVLTYVHPTHTQAAIPVRVGLCPDEREPPKNPDTNLFYRVDHYRLLVKKEQGAWTIFDIDFDQTFVYRWDQGLKQYVSDEHQPKECYEKP